MKMVRAFSIGTCLLWLATTARAVNPNTHISQYGHAVWRVQEGALDGTPTAFAQTPDGYLWVGTQAGLYRFDGVSFTALSQTPRPTWFSSVTSLYPARDGSLWVGFQGGIARWDGEKFTNSMSTHGAVQDIAEDQDGAIWIGRSHTSDSKGPICKVSLDQLRCYGAADGIPIPWASAFKISKQGQFWIADPSTLIEWNGKLLHDYPIDKLTAGSGVAALAVEASGAVLAGMVWPTAGGDLKRLVNGKWESYSVPGFKTADLYVHSLFLDREECLWVGTPNDGLYRIHGDSVDHYGRVDGLSSDDVKAILEDREGSVWVATSEGVDHFYDMPVVSYSKSQGLGTDAEAVLGRRDGSVAVISSGSIYSIQGSTVATTFAHSSHDLAVASLLEDHSGDLWFGTGGGGLAVKSTDGIRTVVKSDGIDLILSLAEDADHQIWVASAGPHPRLLRIENGKVREEFKPPQVPAAYSVIADPHNGIWLSSLTRKLMHYEKGEWQDIPLDSLAKRYGKIAGIFNMTVEANGTLWGASSRGVIAYKDGKAHLLDDRNGLPCRESVSVVFDLHKDLWIQTQCGLMRVARSELERWWADPEVKIKVSNFGATDGFKIGNPLGRPAATRSTDGRLWFQNENVVMMIDPDHLAYNAIVPPVHVQQVIADRVAYPVKDGLRLPIKTRQLELDYAGLSFVTPAKVQFRYMLERHDTQWQDPGTRRAAFYNDLPPGRYTFRVIAANNSGLWNMQGASLHFTIPPAYYQTIWFRGLCVLAFMGLLWLLYQLRLRQLEQEFSAGLEGRVHERTRIARDLHDTLLQTIQGSKLVADSALKQSADPTPMRGAMEQVSIWLERATEEGRAALNSLRTSTTETNDLAAAFRRAIEECRAQSPMEASFSVNGEVSEMHPIVRDEVYRIGYEAIRNACVHSQAAQLQVELRYSDDLTLTVRDNGTGMDSSMASQGKEGHFGLRGMQERASRIMAKLAVETSSATGTEIKLVVPGSIIYRKTTPGRRRSSALRSLLKRMGSTSDPSDS